MEPPDIGTFDGPYKSCGDENVSAGIASPIQDKKLVWSSAAHITAARSCRLFDIFDQLLAGAFACSSCLSHPPLLSGYDEPKTLSYQITLFGPIGADVRHFGDIMWLAFVFLIQLRNISIRYFISILGYLFIIF